RASITPPGSRSAERATAYQKPLSAGLSWKDAPTSTLSAGTAGTSVSGSRWEIRSVTGKLLVVVDSARRRARSRGSEPADGPVLGHGHQSVDRHGEGDDDGGDGPHHPEGQLPSGLGEQEAEPTTDCEV